MTMAFVVFMIHLMMNRRGKRRKRKRRVDQARIWESKRRRKERKGERRRIGMLGTEQQQSWLLKRTVQPVPV